MTDSVSIYIIIAIALLLVLNFLALLLASGSNARRTRRLVEELEDRLRELETDISRDNAEGIAQIRRDIDSRLTYDADENRKNRVELSDMLTKNHERLEKALKESLSEMQETNRTKLNDIRTDINKKLDTSLNERLDASFKNVGDQLNKLYESLGELAKLEDGVSSLNKTLSNVKTRGIFGEMQLEHILTEILPGTLFDRNVVTKRSGRADNRDAVEFAVRIPDKEITGEYMYLPIDSKFPATIYDRIRAASEDSDNEALKTAVKELEQKVKNDARDIRDKYLDPPNTTDFGIMFLPTESLYAEVLRIDGLVESCQSEYHVVITGPSTMAALLNSLSIGFRYMAVNRDSKKILKLLSAVKTQYSTLSRLIGVAAAKLESARKANDELQHRTDIINKRLSSVEELDPLEAGKLLGSYQQEADSMSNDAEYNTGNAADANIDVSNIDAEDVNLDTADVVGDNIDADVVSQSASNAKPQSLGRETEDFL